ncbi:hypothetical protein [Streptomyces sp. SID13588]|nr:hypothetical protein [Streptomyces sp. SID13588]
MPASTSFWSSFSPQGYDTPAATLHPQGYRLGDADEVGQDANWTR